MSDESLQETVVNRIRNAAKPNSNGNIRHIARLKPLMTENRMKFYNNTDEEKDLILHHLDQKYLKLKETEDVVNNGKFLLYFSVFLNDAYVDLLYMCLKSIVANTPTINFDVLFITDAATKAKIEAFDVISNFNVDYMLTESVNSGPLASLKKLNIFDYEKISDYSKILFFDADIICIKDLNILFQQGLEAEKLYVCSTPIHKSPLLLAPTHGIMHLTEADAAFLNDNPNIVPFNAGQFLFLNSSRMKGHFNNIRWLRNAWPDEYFYEQSFMNYYFVMKSLTCPLTIKKKVTTTLPSIGGAEMVTNEIESEEQLISVTYNPRKQNEGDEFDFFKFARFSGNRKLMTVSGATRSNFSKDSLEKKVEMPEGILSEPLLMHGEHTVAIHFAATLSNGLDKKSFINLYANAHKLHI